MIKKSNFCIYTMDLLPRELILNVYRHVYRDNLEKINKEYHKIFEYWYRFGLYDILYCNYATVYLNYRNSHIYSTKHTEYCHMSCHHKIYNFIKGKPTNFLHPGVIGAREWNRKINTIN